MVALFAAPKFLTGENEGGGGSDDKNEDQKEEAKTEETNSTTTEANAVGVPDENKENVEIKEENTADKEADGKAD